MNREIKILSTFFLFVYLSFLVHDLIAHGHHHHDIGHNEHHQVLYDETLEVNLAISLNECSHLLNDCSTCKNDQSLHKQVFFTKEFKSIGDAFIPSKRIRLKPLEPDSAVFFIAGNIPINSLANTKVPQRGPPQNS